MTERPFISIKYALPDIFSTLEETYISVDNALEWASKAMAQMDIYEFHEPRLAFREIKGYQTFLPCGLLQLNQILYRSDFKKDTVFSVSDSSAQVYKDFAEKNQLENVYMHRGWLPMRASTNNFMLSVLCPNSPNLITNCQHEYTILPNGKVVTSFQEGWILISYMSAVKDDSGNFMIPDDQELIEALRLYIMSRIWERRWNMKEEGAKERFEYYVTKWGLYKNMVRGKFKLPNDDQKQNIMDYSTSLLPKKDRYYNYFGSLGVPDQTFS